MFNRNNFFFLGKTLFKDNKTSIIISLLYTLSTYRFHDEIVRGAIGEVFGFVFIPLAFIGLYHIVFGDKKMVLANYWNVLFINFTPCVCLYVFFVYYYFFLFKLLIERDFNDFIKRFALLIIAGISTIFLTL